MIRGLSKLQREILILAYKNKERYPEGKVDISNREVLVKIYGFKPLVNINDQAWGLSV